MKYLITLIIIFLNFFSSFSSDFIELNKQEKEWIKEHPVVYHGYDPEWKPIEFIDANQKYTGIAEGYIRLLEKITGLKFEAKPNLTWSKSVEAFKKDEVLILPCLAITDERKDFMEFTPIYLSYPFVIVNKKNGAFAGKLEDLHGKTISVPKGYFIAKKIKELYPKINLIYTENIEQTLLNVSSGKADATVGNLAVIGYYLNYSGFQDLQIAAPTNFKNIELSIGISKKHPELISIINKGLNAISNKDQNQIQQNWMSVKFEHGVDMAKVWRIAAYSSIIVLIIIGIIFFWNRTLQSQIKRRKKAEAELQESFNRISEQKLIIEHKNEEVMDSIRYAQRIQTALLAEDSDWDLISDDHFVLFKPRDLVSGDFYWAYHNETLNLSIWATADCTGHGVPGAFMSMLGLGFLNEIIIEGGVIEPNKILNILRSKIINSLDQKSSDSQRKDGMDINICVYNHNTNKLKFSGAYNPLFLITKNKEKASALNDKRMIESNNLYLATVNADKMPVGKSLKQDDSFTMHEIQLEKGDSLITFSDGYVDQFGGDDNRKFMSKKFKSLLLSIYDQPMKTQGDILNDKIEDWMKNTKQIDDICVIGIKIT